MFYRQKVILRAKIAAVAYLQLLIKHDCMVYDNHHGLILKLRDLKEYN